MNIYAKIRAAIQKGQSTQTRQMGRGDDPFTDVPATGALLTGFEITYGQFGKNPTIMTMRPIFQTEQGTVTGKVHGVPTAKRDCTEAKPGYALGALTVKAGLGVDGFSATFMKIRGDRLNPSDAYESSWFGGPGGSAKTVLGGDGTPVIGIFGKTTRNPKSTFNGLGLVLGSSEPGPLSTPVEAASPTEPQSDGPAASILGTRLGMKSLTKMDINHYPRCVLFTADSQMLLSGAGADLVWVSVAQGKRLLSVPTAHRASVMCLAMTPDGSLIATGGGDNTVKVWDANKRTELTVLTVKGWPLALAFTPDGKSLLTTAFSGGILYWDRVTGQVRFLDKPGSAADAVAVSPDGKLAAWESSRTSLRLWDLAANQSVAQLQGHSGHIWALAFSPDGKFLASGSDDHTVRIWEVASAKQVAVLEGHKNPVSSLAFSPDGRYMVTGTGGLRALGPGYVKDLGEVTLWEVATGKQLSQYLCKPVNSVAFAPNGRTIGVASQSENAVRLLSLFK